MAKFKSLVKTENSFGLINIYSTIFNTKTKTIIYYKWNLPYKEAAVSRAICYLCILSVAFITLGQQKMSEAILLVITDVLKQAQQLKIINEIYY